jgi:hypothetical protein
MITTLVISQTSGRKRTSEVKHQLTNLEHIQWCLVCDFAKIFLIFQFSYLLFPNPTQITKLRLQIGVRL